jgi:hypothetical protein
MRIAALHAWTSEQRNIVIASFLVRVASERPSQAPEAAARFPIARARFSHGRLNFCTHPKMALRGTSSRASLARRWTAPRRNRSPGRSPGAILLYGDEGSAQVVWRWHRALRRLLPATRMPVLAARPIASPIKWCDAASARCNGSSPLDPPSASSVSMPPSTTHSICNDTSSHDPRCGPSEPKRRRSGKMLSQRHEPDLALAPSRVVDSCRDKAPPPKDCTKSRPSL